MKCRRCSQQYRRTIVFALRTASAFDRFGSIFFAISLRHVTTVRDCTDSNSFSGPRVTWTKQRPLLTLESLVALSSEAEPFEIRPTSHLERCRQPGHLRSSGGSRRELRLLGHAALQRWISYQSRLELRFAGRDLSLGFKQKPEVEFNVRVLGIYFL